MCGTAFRLGVISKLGADQEDLKPDQIPYIPKRVLVRIPPDELNVSRLGKRQAISIVALREKHSGGSFESKS